ncbi:uridine diphosphate-N-acetylglucosamine-binding protein YvcK [Photobacterium damselae]|uniref:uridine diphosphate-N-acetylglucosamine-binding protein YvcK n=1 Tax=Photobacterium damselae TaxID=38293 RepID=UPI0010FCF889|nr:uridine diphosphate-N-acetylglucosamine-binding protein YvcK [Photobacterium damselae]TLS70655.1 uridine diphosphate-N-acetylglucosamine-binding protein YvcK [Photobacterium damselae subsp. damselae]TLS77798.1 uridine diphosphate-N-acetylglucosamine-binding protein YvcK [Photobacterium damselae subsp. damselae]TLS86180.1 uridine diphosphate-N-acetylglucosamine-binding protein YvcK [Photobacterium damselae subsp. damselae]
MVNTNTSNKKIVAIGGGHGLGRILSSLSDYGSQVTGIVATTDNGGSTGRIRACQGGIAWGDTRNCINQLITEPSVGSMIFEYRFRGNGELNGHNLGNLMLTALDNLSVRPLDAINLIRDMLKVSTHIIPMSEYPADLAAMTPSGEIICGETSVDELIEVPQRLYVDPAVPATKEAVVAIEQADLILLGPGSFLTSVMPSLLLKEIAQALKHTSARLVFITNLDKENGPAGQMDLATMLHWCERSIGGRRIDIILSDKYYDGLESSYHQHVSDLAANNHVWRHDRNKLKHAIEQLLIA